MPRCLGLALLVLIGALGCASRPSPDDAARPLAVFECVERLDRAWPRTMVTYAAPLERARVRAEDLRLFDRDGREVPMQAWRVERRKDGTAASARVSFMAELSAKGSYRYELRRAVGPATQPAERLDAAADGAFLTLQNSKVAIRLPRPGTHRFAQPLRFAGEHATALKPLDAQVQSGLAPGPFQGLRLLDGRWVGGSYFHCAQPEQAPRVVGYDCAVTESGPLFVEARVRYQLDNGGFYQFSARVMAGDPAIRIDEQYDLKTVGKTTDWRGFAPQDSILVLSLSHDDQRGGAAPWRPDHAFWGRVNSGNSMRKEPTAIEPRLTELGCDFAGGDFGSQRITHDQPARVLFGVEPWMPYGNFAAFCGLIDAASLNKPIEQIPFVGVMPMHAGTWRGDGPFNYKQLVAHQRGDVAMHWPLSIGPHPGSLMHTGEYDPELPYTHGRRIWALIGGSLQTNTALRGFRAYEGHINLDNYKEWVLDWPDEGKVEYPRLFLGKADVEAMRPALDKHVAGARLKDRLYFKDDPKRRDELTARLMGPYGLFGVHSHTRPDLATWFILWRQAHNAEEWLAGADELLSSPSLAPQVRQQVRIKAAAYGHLLSEPDFTPRGSMTSLGTPNMSMIRLLALPMTAALIPDHPRGREWLDISERYVRYKMAVNIAPGGGWSELFTYYDAAAPTLMHVVNILRRNGRLSDDLARQAGEAARFPLYFLAPPDPRLGVRMVPAWGHEGREVFGQWLPAAAMMRTLDPAFRRAMLWGWRESGKFAGYHDGAFNERVVFWAGDSAPLPPDDLPRELGSAWVPGVGAVLRDHAGAPSETYLAYRQGYMISHCDDNQGDFVLHARGAPLVDMSMFAYGMHQHEPYINLNLNFGYYSIPRFGALTNVGDMRQGANRGDTAGSWNPSSAVDAHSFSASVDYLRGALDMPSRPATPTTPAAGLQRWTRQIVFLKGDTRSAASPSYFVFRDSADAPRGDAGSLTPMWWTIRTVGDKSQVTLKPGALHYTSALGPRPRLDVTFLQPASLRGPLPGETREAGRTLSNYGHADQWRKGGDPILTHNQSAWRQFTESFAVTTLGPIAPGEDVMSVLYPRATDELAARCESLGDGAMRIVTPEGTDYVFVAAQPMSFDGGEVAFSGLAGAVRVRRDQVHLVIAEGPGQVRYKGVTLRGDGPTTRVLSIAEAAAPRVIVEPSRRSSIRMDLDMSGKASDPAAGVKRFDRPQGFTVVFDSATAMRFEKDGLEFEGRRGGVEVDERRQSCRLVMLDGDRIGAAGRAAWGAAGPYEVTYLPDRVRVRSGGQGRFLRLSRPAEISGMIGIHMDGRVYAPGLSNTVDPAQAGRSQGSDSPEARLGTLIVPLLDGERHMELRALEQAPVWRNWVRW